VGGLGEHVTCHMFRFLSILFFLKLYSWDRADFDDLYVIRRVSAQRKEVPFEGY